jgi:uncharacterized protein
VGDLRRLSNEAARRLVLAAQGFTRPRPTGRVSRQHLRRVMDDVGVIQVDSVNVLVRSHELPLFARLGPHPRTLIPDAVAAGDLFEYWAHVASFVPTKHLHLWRWRMEAFSEGRYAHHSTERQAGTLTRVLSQVREQGPIAVGDVDGRVRNPGSWWNWDDAKLALERLFDQGVVSVTRRKNDFARLYDLIERIVPAAALAVPPTTEPEARRQLLLLAARSLGVATLADLCDYYRLSLVKCRPVVAALVAAGQLVPVQVDGWSKPAFLHPDAAAPRRVSGRALLTPFDSLIWFRERTERLFDFTYRIEIYTPKPKRTFGYYVLPFLLDGHLVGRVDLKADRPAGLLRVQASWIEDDLDNPGDRPVVAEQLAAELAAMAGWLGLDGGVAAAARGNLARDLLDTPNVMPIVEPDA